MLAGIKKRLAGAVGIASVVCFMSSGVHAADEKLIQAAKKDGSLTWYTTLIVGQVVRPLVEAFKEKYGINVEFVSMSGQDVSLRVMNEAKAGAIAADVFDGFMPFVVLSKAGLVAQYEPESAAGYLPALREHGGMGTANFLQPITAAVNTDVVAEADYPKTFQDLLDPKWKDKMAWSNFPSITGVAGFVGSVLISMGEEKGMEYLRKLSEQNIANVPSNPRVVLDQAIAGQYPVVLGILNYHAAISAEQGAPVKWLPLDYTPVVSAMVGVVKDSPKPNAARLFVDYMVSEEGQKVFAKAGYIPAHPNVDAAQPEVKPERGGYAYEVMTPAIASENLDKWLKIYKEIFE